MHIYSSKGWRLIRTILDAIVNKQGDKINQNHAETIRREVAALVGCTDWGPVQSVDYQTQLRGHLIHDWATSGQDPGAVVASWLWLGAPANIEASMDELDGLHRRAEDEDVDDYADRWVGRTMTMPDCW